MRIDVNSGCEEEMSEGPVESMSGDQLRDGRWLLL